MTDPWSELRAMIQRDAFESMRTYVGQRRAERQAKEDADFKRRAETAKPSWDRWRSERDLQDLVHQVAAGDSKPTAEQIALHGRLMGGGGK